MYVYTYIYTICIYIYIHDMYIYIYVCVNICVCASYVSYVCDTIKQRWLVSLKGPHEDWGSGPGLVKIHHNG